MGNSYTRRDHRTYYHDKVFGNSVDCGNGIIMDEHGGSINGERYTRDNNGNAQFCKEGILDGLLSILENGDPNVYPRQQTKDCIKTLIDKCPEIEDRLRRKISGLEEDKIPYLRKLRLLEEIRSG